MAYPTVDILLALLEPLPVSHIDLSLAFVDGN